MSLCKNTLGGRAPDDVQWLSWPRTRRLGSDLYLFDNDSLTSDAEEPVEDFEDVGAPRLLLDGDLVDVSRKRRKKPVLTVSSVPGSGLDAGVVIWVIHWRLYINFFCSFKAVQP